jgi:hypothetical protein
VVAQEPPEATTLKPGDKAEVLFVASAPDAEKDESGKPALASLDPVAFFVGGELRDCATAHPAPGEENVPKATVQTLNRTYAAGRRYPLWWGGAPWGEAEAIRSCIDGSDGDSLDFSGCFRLHPDNAHRSQKDFKGTVWAGKVAVANHPALRVKANTEERDLFLQAASAAFATRHVRISPSSIHSGVIWKRQFQSGHTALAGSTLIQLASTKPKTYYSYRIFLVMEEDKGAYLPVLEHFHRATIPLENVTDQPKPGEVIDQEGDADKEVFIDNYPSSRVSPIQSSRSTPTTSRGRIPSIGVSAPAISFSIPAVVAAPRTFETLGYFWSIDFESLARQTGINCR